MTSKRLLSMLVAGAAIVAFLFWHHDGGSAPRSSATKDSGHSPQDARSAAREFVDDAGARGEGGARRQVRLLDDQGGVVDGGVVEAMGPEGLLGTGERGHGGVSIPVTECLLHVSAAGFMPRFVRCTPGQGTVDVVLSRARTIAVTVASSGQPAVGIKVRFRNAIQDSPVLVDDVSARQWLNASPESRVGMLAKLWGEDVEAFWTRAAVEARTNEHGQVRIAVSVPSIQIEVAGGKLSATSSEVAFQRRGSWSVSAPFRLAGEASGVVVELARSGSIVKGRIDGAGSSVQGSCVLRYEVSGGPGIIVQDVEQQAELRADGGFEFDCVSPGSKTVVVTARRSPGEPVFAELVFAVAAVQVDIDRVHDLGSLSPSQGGLDVQVGLRDARHAPVDAPDCRWRLFVGTNPQAGPVLAEAIGGVPNGGRVRLRGLPPGEVTISADLEQGVALPGDLRIFDSRGLRRSQAVTSAGEVRLEGLVTRFLSTDIVVEGAGADAREWQGALFDVELGASVPGLASHRDGSDVVARVELPQESRRYRFELHSERGACGEYAVGEVVVAGGGRMRVEPQSAAAVRGSVLGRSGAGEVKRVIASCGSGWRSAEVDPTGAFVVRGLLPNAEYRLEVLGKALERLPFEGAEDGRFRFSAGAAGEVLDLGNLVVETAQRKH